MAKKGLTRGERKTLDCIRSYHDRYGGYPTYREIQVGLRLKSINSITQYLRQLAKKGFIEPLKRRGFRLADQLRESLARVPLLGTVPAGSPTSTQELEEQIAVPQGLVPSGASSFALKVRGGSMEEAGIFEGDMVVVDSKRKPKLGDIVVALINGENTVKRFDTEKGRYYLKAESRHHRSIHPMEEWSIQGVVTGLMRQY
jgi:repressor LexA